MDERCKNALKHMKLSHLIALFEEKQIDYETLKLFHDYPDTIPSIISNIGDQLKLRKGIKSIIEENENIQDQTVDAIVDTISVISPSTSISQFSEPFDSSSSIASYEIKALAVETTSGKRLCLEEVIEHNNPIILKDNPSENYIYEILQKTALGKAILELYKQSTLDNNIRCKLAELVIQAEYGADINKTISGKRFVQLAKWTVECFPTEFVETYYIPSSERGKGRSAAGKFYDAYTNLNKELRKAKLRKISSQSSQLPFSGLKTSIGAVPKDDITLKKSLEFLQVQLEPWEQMKECWEYTSTFRLNQLRDEENKDLKVADYINKYPILKQPGGHLLLEYDFQVLFKGIENRPTLLKTLITEHLQLFKELFPDKRVKPKGHNFVHYGTVLEQSGPIINLSSIRFEGKHKDKKREANCTTSRKNITKTLCIKEQLVLSYRLMLKKGLTTYEDYGSEESLDHISACENFFLFSCSVPSIFNGPCLLLSWVKISGITYKFETCVVMQFHKENDNLPVFGLIEKIFQNDNGEIGFVCRVMVTYGFDSHFHAYEVELTTNLTFIQLKDLISPFPVIHIQIGNGCMFAIMRHKL